MVTLSRTRAIICFVFFFIWYMAIIANLYYIQIVRGDFYTHLGHQQYHVIHTVASERAPIFDRSGKRYLAMNKEAISAFITPQNIKNPQKLLAFLKLQFPQAYERLQATPTKQFLFVERALSDQKKTLIEQADLEDIHFLKEPSRFYPIESAGIITGITDRDNNGLFGLELLYNDTLQGKPATVMLEKDARSGGNFYFSSRTIEPGNPGKPVTTTIDSNVQFLVNKEVEKTVAKLESKEGSAIVVDPTTGDILAMVCTPSFNPNNTKELIMEQTKNKIVTDTYEFGSVMKPFAALAALAEKVVTMDELIDCENKKTTIVEGRKINTWKAHGVIPFWQVIAFSNNIGIAKIAKRLGPLLYDHYLKLGFCTKYGLPFPGEQSGFVNPPANWSKQSIISLSYGYEITATLLQLARAFCIIAQDGHDQQIRLVLDPPVHKKNSNRVLYDPDVIAQIKTILAHTAEEGTAHRAKIKGYSVMCKTGTAELLGKDGYDRSKNIFTCGGIIEKDGYKRVLVVFLKETSKKKAFAANTAVPLFHTLAEKLLVYDHVL